MVHTHTPVWRQDSVDVIVSTLEHVAGTLYIIFIFF